MDLHLSKHKNLACFRRPRGQRPQQSFGVCPGMVDKAETQPGYLITQPGAGICAADG